ncbi:exonuclease V [Sulfitobacter phage phiCB2047-B]|uniref:DNA helicase n=1 Tax=Sulfitobacter phage phiCB2047-B TaxID=754046 RepID=M4PMY5_9CAUD|nr:exonuclease V [Sulfitobacter phage phiCB2047-B]AGH07398.1 DNA helicase [Sulfitobacter phage phiCB2047-B]
MRKLNEEQQSAFIDVIAFINDPDRKFHRVSGGAGTGKTFFIEQVEGNILKHKEPHVNLSTVALTATTNKAAAVLSQSIPHKRTEIKTIYSFMNLRVSSNFNTGETKIVPTRNWDVHDRTLIIVDEASMVNRSLYDYIEKGTTSQCKILFVGDKNQLSPVKESISPVYINKFSESLLIKPVRNAEQPALMELCEQAVETVLTGKFFKIKEVPGVIDFVDGNRLKGVLEREYSVEDPNKRLLCYTNKRVIEYNNHIRMLRGFTEHYNVGEMVINNASAELTDKSRLYTDQMVQIIEKSEPYENGDIVQGHVVDMIDLEVRDPNTFAMYSVTVFAEPADRQEAIKYYSGIKKWDRYFKIKETYPDLRSVAASTTHKAQGSTYESVIVDLADIGKSTNSEQTARMQYVALSRPKQRIYIRGELPERYFE